MSTPEWDRVFLAVTDTFWPEFFHGELNQEDLDKAAAVADLVTKNGSEAEPGVTPVATGTASLSPTGDGAGASAASSPAPSSPRSFELHRHVDVTGQSGTGIVVEGTQWTDGTVSIRWRGANPSFANWPSVESLLAVHGHEGATELVWLGLPETMFRTTDIDLSDDEPLEQVHFVPIEDDEPADPDKTSDDAAGPDGEPS